MVRPNFTAIPGLSFPAVESSSPVVAGTDWQWLEKPQGAKSLEWAKHETELSQKYLDALPQAPELHDRLQTLLQHHEALPTFALCGRLFRLRRDIVHTKGVLEVSELETPGEWRTLLDVDDLGRCESKEWHLSPLMMAVTNSCYIGGKSPRLLIKLSEGGSDEISLREFDVDQAVWVPNGFTAPQGRYSAAWLDLDHILITHALNSGPTCGTGWPIRTYIWTRGTDLAEARLVRSGSTSDAITMCTAISNGVNRRGLIMSAATYATIRYYTVTLDGIVEAVELPESVNLALALPATSRHVFATTTETSITNNTNILKDSLVAWNYIGGQNRLSVVYTPVAGESIVGTVGGGVTASHSRVFFTTRKRTTERRIAMEYIEEEWKLIDSNMTPKGVSAMVPAADPCSDNIIVQTTGLLTPANFRLEHSGGQSKTDLYNQRAAFDHSSYAVETQVAVSKDGTEIDYIMLAPKQRRRKLPVLMTGYGAFGVIPDLSYVGPFLGGLTLVPWLEAGGALVVPWIRGGSERGEDWHQAALRENRQRSYDDFIAVAEKLISDGVTAPRSIGVFGTSNGGLLAAVMGTQRPDLFGAVVSDVPLTDMLRFPQMGMGSAWINEYGDPKVPAQAKALQSYSPFHNVDLGVSYPPMLVTCSTLDDRVGVGHGRKFIARLKEAKSPKALLYEETAGGHSITSFDY